MEISPTANQNPYFNAVAENLHEELKISMKNAEKATAQFFKKQQEMTSEKGTHFLKPSESFPYCFVVSKKSILWVKEKVGSGGEMDVFKVHVFPTDRYDLSNKQIGSPSKPFQAALKTAKYSHVVASPKKRILNEILDNQDVEGVDRFLETYINSQGLSQSLHQLYDSDLATCSFFKLSKPVHKMLQGFISTSSFLAILHAKGYIHCDIKRKNLLVKKEPWKVVVSDFGTLSTVDPHEHNTNGTPLYMDPYLFITGPDRDKDAEDNLIHQKNRRGRQTTESDVFSFGRTLETTVLFFLAEISQKIPNGLELYEIIKKMGCNQRLGQFSCDELQDFGKKFPFLSIFKSENDPKTNKIIDTVYLFPTLGSRRENCTKACSMLNDFLNSEEIQALICLYLIACNLQEAPHDRPTMEEVNSILQTIFTTLENEDDFHQILERLEDNRSDTTKKAKINLIDRFEEAIEEDKTASTILNLRDHPEVDAEEEEIASKKVDLINLFEKAGKE